MTNYKELLAQRETLDKQIEESRKVELGLAIAHVRQLVTEWGMTPEDCGFRSGAASANRKAKPVSVAVPKYRGPNGETWTGHGRPPAWLLALEAEGHPKAEFLIS